MPPKDRAHSRTLAETGRVSPKDLPKGPHGRALCRMCQTEVPPSRKTFCGPECIHQWKLRSNPGYAAKVVLARDHGICAICGVDCLALRREGRALLRTPQLAEWLQKHEVPLARLCGRRIWDMDHTVPVVEGGGTCSLDNLRTLCIKCHRRVTAELAARRAASKLAGPNP